jgi:hypothetical protein
MERRVVFGFLVVAPAKGFAAQSSAAWVKEVYPVFLTLPLLAIGPGDDAQGFGCESYRSETFAARAGE